MSAAITRPLRAGIRSRLPKWRSLLVELEHDDQSDLVWVRIQAVPPKHDKPLYMLADVRGLRSERDIERTARRFATCAGLWTKAGYPPKWKMPDTLRLVP